MGPPPERDLNNLELWIVFFTNLERTDLDRHPLMLDLGLREAARWHAKYLTNIGFLNHVSRVKDMATAGDRIKHFKGKVSLWGENISVVFQSNVAGHKYILKNDIFGNYRDYGNLKLKWYDEREAARRLVNSWLNSPPHREGMLNLAFRRIGAGVALGTYAEEGSIYGVEVFSNDQPGFSIRNVAYKKREIKNGQTIVDLKFFYRPYLEPVVFGYGHGHGRIDRLRSTRHRDSLRFVVPPDDENDMIYRIGAYDPSTKIYYPLRRVAWLKPRYP